MTTKIEIFVLILTNFWDFRGYFLSIVRFINIVFLTFFKVVLEWLKKCLNSFLCLNFLTFVIIESKRLKNIL